ncbi:MAG: hypothetical protein ACOC2O_02885 [Bacillota bacterium]
MSSNYVKRFNDNPIIRPGMKGLEGDKGQNINGPSLIKVPDWVNNPLGKYYLYFAHHGGNYIRLAYAEQLKGPWEIYQPGTLHLDQTVCDSHVASPDVHIDNDNKEILMYFHGPSNTEGVYEEHGQLTYLATSDDGINFTAHSEVIAPFYFKRFKHQDCYYGIAKNRNTGGLIARSKDPGTKFEFGKNFIDNMRHATVLKKGNQLYVFYSRMRDKPERILMSKVELNQDWLKWEPSAPLEIMRPQKEYEGINQPLKESRPGGRSNPVHELRDPEIYEENGDLYLFYSVAGEQGIALAEVFFDKIKNDIF